MVEEVNILNDDVRAESSEEIFDIALTPNQTEELIIDDTFLEALQRKEPEIQILMVKGDPGDSGSAVNYEQLSNKPSINGITLVGNKTASDLGLDLADIVHINTSAYWNAQPTLIGERGHVYLYTDYETIDGTTIPAFKISDGLAYLIDTPFVDGNATALNNHISDSSVHLMSGEREFWNNKVRCYLSLLDNEELVFTTN